MSYRQELRAHYAAVHQRLHRPPNAVPDRGIDLGGRALAAALADMRARETAETPKEKGA